MSDFMGEKAILHKEHTSNVLALRRGSIFGLIAWILLGLTDVSIVHFVEPGRIWLYLLMRAVGGVMLGYIAMRLHLQPVPTPRMLRFLDAFAFAGCSAFVSVTCIEFGGLDSPLAMGIVIILICRLTLIPDRWQHCLLPVGITAIVHPAVLLSMTLFSPHMAMQLNDSRVLGGFIFNQAFIFSAATLVIFVSHRMWRYRRQVYEAQSLGRYRLKKRIGRGGMGEVWIAHHSTLDREVAVKVLRPDKMDSQTVLRFEREVKATSELSHPNTVRVFEYGVTEDGLCYYAMELLHGYDLSALLKKSGPQSPKRVIDIATQAAKALNAAHSYGIIHRDLKPGNLIVTPTGDGADLVKVVDFGLALVTSCEHDSAVTHTGYIVGTPAYIAPELLSGRPADARSDLYALGAVMYELLCGFPPFYTKDSRRSLMLRSWQEVPPPSEILGQELPQDLESIVLKCLRRDPNERYQTAETLIKALNSCHYRYSLDQARFRDEVDEVETLRSDKEHTLRLGQVVSSANIDSSHRDHVNVRSVNRSRSSRNAIDSAGYVNPFVDEDSSEPAQIDEKTKPEKPVSSEIIGTPSFAEIIDEKTEPLTMN